MSFFSGNSPRLNDIFLWKGLILWKSPSGGSEEWDLRQETLGHAGLICFAAAPSCLEVVLKSRKRVSFSTVQNMCLFFLASSSPNPENQSSHPWEPFIFDTDHFNEKTSLQIDHALL